MTENLEWINDSLLIYLHNTGIVCIIISCPWWLRWMNYIIHNGYFSYSGGVQKTPIQLACVCACLSFNTGTFTLHAHASSSLVFVHKTRYRIATFTLIFTHARTHARTHAHTHTHTHTHTRTHACTETNSPVLFVHKHTHKICLKCLHTSKITKSNKQSNDPAWYVSPPSGRNSFSALPGL